MATTLTAGEVRYPREDRDLDLRWWAAANYLTAGQIYLRGNPLLREPLTPEHIKPRLLGHWGTGPGISMVYAVINRVIRATGTDWLFVTGPGHGGPALVAAAYLDGTYSEVYPDVTRDEAGLRRLFRRFSTPGGVPSHVGPQTPGSIHEGGELGYALAHAGGAAFDHPDLHVACVIGDGEAETGPLSASWRLPSFLNPLRDGAVLPIVHLNGYKIAGPTVLGRASDEDVEAYLASQGWDVTTVAGDDPEAVIARLHAAVTRAQAAIAALRAGVRSGRMPAQERHRWPAIVLRTPKGWTGPRFVDGAPMEGTHRAHQVPLGRAGVDERQLEQLSAWLRSYRPEELFDEHGRIDAAIAALAPDGDRRMSATPYANGGRLRRPLPMPPVVRYAIAVDRRGAVEYENTRPLGGLLRDLVHRTTGADGGGTFRLMCPDETASNRLQDVFEVTDRCLCGPVGPNDEQVSADGRVMEVLSEHLCQGWLEGYVLSGRHGLFATYEAFAMVSVSMAIQHVKWLQHARRIPWRDPVSSLNVLLTSTCWRNDHNGFSHQGPGMIDALIPLAPEVVRIWLPPDANSTLVVADACLRSTDQLNVIVVDKQRHLQYLSFRDAREHCAAGAGIWQWAGTASPGATPDVVLACAGDVATKETLAAAQLLAEHTPELAVRVVNVVDLMALLPEADHPHGFSDSQFDALFTADRHVVFAFHGYPRAIHQLVHGRSNATRFHVRGFSEQGSTTTPFDMLVLNRASRYHLVIEALRRAGRRVAGWEDLLAHCRRRLEEHDDHIRRHLVDLPDVAAWRWGRA